MIMNRSLIISLCAEAELCYISADTVTHLRSKYPELEATVQLARHYYHVHAVMFAMRLHADSGFQESLS